ncbi:hypothetical protein RP20_CCG019015 [Aedes albopictus]|nr:hypothetical protein RP20_CCG019015 [Aedes albopictus]
MNGKQDNSLRPYLNRFCFGTGFSVPPDVAKYKKECVTDRCSRYPCQHGGKCLPSDDGAICLCPLGFGGDLCEMRLDLQILDRPGIEPVTLSMVMLNTRAFTASAIWAI